MNPSDFRICHLQFRYSLYACVALKHKYGSPVLHDSSSTAYHPCYPGRSDDPLSLSRIINYGFPPVSTGSASPLQVDEATYRFTCVTVCSFAQRKLTTLDYSNAASWTKEVYEQFLLRDFNPIRLIADNGIRTRYLI